MLHTWKIKLFAGLPERFGTAELLIETTNSAMTAGELKQAIMEASPENAEIVKSAFVAKNHAYATDGETVDAKDELALLPPVSGGEHDSSDTQPQTLFLITENPIDTDEVLRKVIDKAHGASLVFVGTTREWTQGRQTVHLEYEAYEPMAVGMMKQIGDEIAEKWIGAKCAITHRIGTVGLAEISVVIAVSAPHREACYDASRYAIERLKQTVPIWKKEIWDDGSEWKGHQQGPWNPVAVPEKV